MFFEKDISTQAMKGIITTFIITIILITFEFIVHYSKSYLKQ